MTTKREYGSGGVSWLKGSNYRALLRVRVEMPEGTIRRSKTVKVRHKDHGGRGDALAELEKFRTELATSAAVTPSSGPSLAKLLTEYANHCRTRNAASTVQSYIYAAKRIPGELGSRPLTTITSKDLDTLYDDLAKRLGDNTVRQTHAILSAAFEQAIKWEYITENPVSKATPPKKKKVKRAPLLLADVNRMIVAALTPRDGEVDGDPVLAMAVLLAALTGCRRGELAGLRWDDLDTATGTLRVERQWIPGGPGGQYLDTPKTDEERMVELDALGLGLIEGYRLSTRERLNREPEGWLLSHDAGSTPLKAKALGVAISSLGATLSLTVTTHSFRRVAATELVAAGVDVDTAARRLGHTTEVMLSSYVLGSKDRSVAAAKALEQRFVEQGLNLTDVFSTKELPE
jgi:integrase